MPFKKNTIGILGAGQLARMIALRAREMGFKVNLLTKNKTDPAVSFCDFWYPADLNDKSKVIRFFTDSDVITFESEFFSASKLNFLPDSLKKKIFPSLDNLSKLQDRWPQKELLYDYEIPTSPYLKLNAKDDIDTAFKIFNRAVVFKKRFGGYDGFGTYVVRNLTQLSSFKQMTKGNESNYIAEKLIAFNSEKSILFARNRSGKKTRYPMFESLQKNNQCYQVCGPQRHPSEKALVKKIYNILDDLNYVGVIAFELFEAQGQLIVNEIAPRVHNTGHITLSAFPVSQFDMHLRCILDMPLPSENELAKKESVFLMQNLIGSTVRSPVFSHEIEGQLFWYEKTQNRPFRKMGHINYAGSNLKDLKKKALLDLKRIKI